MNCQINGCPMFINLPDGHSLQVDDQINIRGENHLGNNLEGLYKIIYLFEGQIGLVLSGNTDNKFKTFHILNEKTIKAA